MYTILTYNKIILILIFVGLSLGSIAQKGTSKSDGSNTYYNTGIGFRAGGEGGLTIKHFIRESRAIEGILSRSWGYGGARITGLYEVQKSIKGFKKLSWFYGVGGHIGFYNGGYYGYRAYNGGYYDNKGNWHPTGYRTNYAAFGIDGILGLEYQFIEIPFTVGLDIKPYFDFIGSNSQYWDGAFSIRYVMK